MTTVEELREKIHARVPYMDVDVTLLISAARSEGVAEGAEQAKVAFEKGRTVGAEQKRQQILRASIDMPNAPNGTVTVIASVLATTKEGEK